MKRKFLELQSSPIEQGALMADRLKTLISTALP